MDKLDIETHFNAMAEKRGRWSTRNAYYHDVLVGFFRRHVRPSDSLIDLGCGDGDILARLDAKRRVGLDLAEAMVSRAQDAHPDITFLKHDCETPYPEQGSFDVAILSNMVEFSTDILRLFETVNGCLRMAGTACIATINPLWEPILGVAERLGLKMPDGEHNAIPNRYLMALLKQRGFGRVHQGSLLLVPKRIPGVSDCVNWIAARTPVLSRFCMVQTLVAEKVSEWTPSHASDRTCSVVVPCYNEEANVEACVTRIPNMGKGTEILIVDDGSTDGTASVAQRMAKEDPRVRLISYAPNRGKGHAVKAGFDGAKGDILMILDADVTVMPEELPLFFDAIAGGRGDFANGTRMIYPMEHQAMRLLNHMGNLFFGTVLSWLLSQKVSDTLCGTKALKREDVGRIPMGEDTWGDFDLLFGAAENRLRIVEIPVHYKARTGGLSKMKPFKHTLVLFKVCVKGFLRLKNPFRVTKARD